MLEVGKSWILGFKQQKTGETKIQAARNIYEKHTNLAAAGL